MSTKLAVVMDPIGSIHVKKDTTFALLLAAQARGWSLSYMEQSALSLRDGAPFGWARSVHVKDDPEHWYTLGEGQTVPLTDFDVTLMRKDPPVDSEYLYATYILERAEEKGVLVVNRPRALRDANEKIFTAWFPSCCPPTLISSRTEPILEFLEEHREIVVKPAYGHGGQSIFRLKRKDPNLNVVLETMTAGESRAVIVQEYLPAIVDGDKRILLIDGDPVPFALARIPSNGEWRGNLARGAKGTGVELSERDRWICAQVGPKFKEMGLLFVGLDVIGNYLTEINVTSPTCVRELEAIYAIPIAGRVLDAIEKKLKGRISKG